MLAFLKNFLLIFLILTLISCVAYKPIFDQNKKFIDVGQDVANQDFENCKLQADKYLKQYKAKRIANEASRKALFGSIFGGLMGLVFGNNAKSAISGAVAGGIFGGIYGGVSVASKDNLKPDEIKQRDITRCLNQQGYDIIGWY